MIYKLCVYKKSRLFGTRERVEKREQKQMRKGRELTQLSNKIPTENKRTELNSHYKVSTKPKYCHTYS